MTVAHDLGALWFVLYKVDDGTWAIWPKHGYSAEEADQIMNVALPSHGLNPFTERKVVAVTLTLPEAP